MIRTKYQLIILGSKSRFKDKIIESLYRHVIELGISKKVICIIEESNFKKQYKGNAPSFCLYFGKNKGVFENKDLLDILKNDAVLILPIVNNFKNFKKSIPVPLHNINGFEFSSKNSIEPLVGLILEGFGLLRLSRRLFISYKRDESSTVAIQLYEEFEKNGFDVFLDTHSIRSGEPFQDELWHRLADTDVVVLLNTPGFLNSSWTTQELAQANAMSIGIIQLIWPSHSLERDAKLSIPYQFQKSDFGNNKFKKSNSYLQESTISKVISQTESLRARSLASRQDNIITEFIKTSKAKGINVELQPEKFLSLKRSNGKVTVIIPTVGVPQAFTYNQSEELIQRINKKNVQDIYLLFDHRNIREKWLKHLTWLDLHLPIKSIKIIDAEKWLSCI